MLVTDFAVYAVLGHEGTKHSAKSKEGVEGIRDCPSKVDMSAEEHRLDDICNDSYPHPLPLHSAEFVLAMWPCPVYMTLWRALGARRWQALWLAGFNAEDIQSELEVYGMINPKTISDLMRQAITEARNSRSEDSGVHPSVGALIVDAEGNVLQHAHRGEEPGCHAEYLCIKKSRDAHQNLEGCMLFVTLEPCTARGPDKRACCTHILESGLTKVYIGMLDPNPAICGRGETRLRYDIGVDRFPSELVKEIETINKEFIALHRDAHLSEESLYVRVQIHQIMRDSLVRKGIPLDEELPIGVNLTTSDISRVCEATCAASAKDIVGIDDLVEQARAEAFDKKYADRTYDDDGRGLGDHWKHALRSILAEMGAPDFPKRRIAVVGIGNGLEGKELYADCTKLTAVDIAEKSLQRAATILRRATTLRTAAENLKHRFSQSASRHMNIICACCFSAEDKC